MSSSFENGFLKLYRKFVYSERILRQYQPVPLEFPAHYYEPPTLPPGARPQVSMVIPSYNYEQYIERTVESILQQSYPQIELIVQDGGSTDGTMAQLEPYRAQLAHVESAPDGGQAEAINRGFEHATGEIMAWLNADDILLPGAIAYVVDYFLRHPEIDVVYGHRIMIDEQEREVGRFLLPPHDDEILLWADHLPQESLFWRRRLWDKVGGYIDESYQFAMDWELLLRFQHAEANFVRLPRLLGAFRVHPQQKTLALNEVGMQEMARLRYAEHGRDVSWFEVKWRTKRYLSQIVWLNLLHRYGFVDC